MPFKIRRAKHEDAAGIIGSHRRSIREVCSRDYNPLQVAAWSGRDFQEERWRQTMDKDFVWVVVDENEKIFGFGHLVLRENSPGKLAGLYFVPEVVGLGLGRKIFELMVEECKRAGVTELLLSATKTAKNFYEKMGFVQLGPILSIQIGGEMVECFEMKAVL